jgi:hypothetical protein
MYNRTLSSIPLWSQCGRQQIELGRWLDSPSPFVKVLIPLHYGNEAVVLLEFLIFLTFLRPLYVTFYANLHLQVNPLYL